MIVQFHVVVSCFLWRMGMILLDDWTFYAGFNATLIPDVFINDLEGIYIHQVAQRWLELFLVVGNHYLSYLFGLNNHIVGVSRSISHLKSVLYAWLFLLLFRRLWERLYWWNILYDSISQGPTVNFTCLLIAFQELMVILSPVPALPYKIRILKRRELGMRLVNALLGLFVLIDQLVEFFEILCSLDFFLWVTL
jgi:hypothetical protein